MPGDSGWWQRHLGQPQAPAPQYQQPQGYQQAPQYPPQGPPQAPQYQQAPQGYPQQQGAIDTSQIRVTGENLYEAAQLWQGGPGTRTETQHCPQCGGNHFFSRTTGTTRGPAPAPLCYDCGFNGQFIQGDPANWNATG